MTRPANRVVRVHVPDRLVDGISVGELEDAIALFRAQHLITDDLTSASTKAFPPPAYFIEETTRAVTEGRSGYTARAGELRVREALAPRLGALLGAELSATDLMLTAGTQAGLFATLSALVDHGDRVLIADPEYLCDERVIRYLGGEPRYVPFTRYGGDAALDLDVIEAELSGGARVLVFSNPHNPTGSVFRTEWLSQLAALIAEHDALVVADELYARFVYDEGTLGHLVSLPGMRERCVTAIGPSKTESASGYRIGVLVGPPELLHLIGRVHEITTVRAPAYAQYALEHWLVDDIDLVRDYLARYRALRDVTIQRISEIEAVKVVVPAATAWLFPDVSGLGRTDREVVEALIEQGILVKTGSAFGPAGHGCLRLCFGQPETTWSTTLERLVTVFERLRAGASHVARAS